MTPSELRSRQPSRRPLIAGIALVLAYLVVAWVSVQAGLVLRSPLYDGLFSHPPYRWVSPPEERVDNNEPPVPDEFEVQVSTSGQADPGSVTTNDGQHTLTFNYLPPAPQPYTFTISMTPRDPQDFAPPPPGFYFDSNAYELESRRADTGEPIDGHFTSIMRFSALAPQMLELQDGEWTVLPDPLYTEADHQVSADTPASGVFVAAGTGIRPPEEVGGLNPFALAQVAVGVLGLGLLLAGAVVALRRRDQPAE